MKAIWKGEILAESPITQEIENNHYFPPESLNTNYFQLSDTHSFCPQKGKANYFNIKVAEDKNPDAAWFYPHPNSEVGAIKYHVAFGNGVEIKK